MERRFTTGLIVSVIWVLGLLAEAARAAEADTADLYGRAVAWAQPNSPWDLQWQQFKARVAQDPTIQIDYFTRGERGGEEQMMHDLRRGRAHIGGMSLQGLSTVIPELTIPMAPYLFESAAEVDFVYDEYLLDLFNDIAAEKGLMFLQWVEVGWTNVYSNAPILVPADANGRKLRGSPNIAAQYFLDAIGADSIPLSTSDLVPALQTGLINGGLSSTVFHFFVTRQYAEHFTLTRHSYDTGAIVVNREWFLNATPAQRQTIRTAWGSSAEARAGIRKLVAGALAAMREEGIEVHDLTPGQRAQWLEAVEGTEERLVRAVGGRARDVLEAIEAGKRAFRRNGSSVSGTEQP